MVLTRTVVNGCGRLRTVADGCERLRTVANSCGRLWTVAQRLANTAQPPHPQSETGTLATQWGKKKRGQERCRLDHAYDSFVYSILLALKHANSTDPCKRMKHTQHLALRLFSWPSRKGTSVSLGKCGHLKGFKHLSPQPMPPFTTERYEPKEALKPSR